MFAAACRRYIKQFFAHAVRRHDHGIHGLAVTAMRSHRIAMVELPVIRRENAAVLEVDAAWFEARDRGQLAVGGAKAKFTAIGF